MLTYDLVANNDDRRSVWKRFVFKLEGLTNEWLTNVIWAIQTGQSLWLYYQRILSVRSINFVRFKMFFTGISMFCKFYNLTLHKTLHVKLSRRNSSNHWFLHVTLQLKLITYTGIHTVARSFIRVVKTMINTITHQIFVNTLAIRTQELLTCEHIYKAMETI